MSYVYRHIRLDTDEVFYVGIGSDSNYKRSKAKHGRSKYWNNIISKTSYKVEIMLDNLSWEDACNKEIEFIKLYGRKNLELGTLVNLTDGGDGNYGLKVSLETRKLKSESMKEVHRRGVFTTDAVKAKYKENGKRYKEKLASGELIHNCKGKNLSEETRKKISTAHKGMKSSEETKKKLSQINLGKKLSLETKLKMSETQKNRNQKKLSDENIRLIKEELKGGLSCAKIAKMFNVAPSTISNIKLKKYHCYKILI